MHHPSLKSHPSPLGHGGWSLSPCLPHTSCSPNASIPAPGSGEESEEDDEEEGDHDVEKRGDSSESDDSEAEFSDDMFYSLRYILLLCVFNLPVQNCFSPRWQPSWISGSK